MKAKRPRFDVLGIGTVAVDELIVAETYPVADSKTRVLHAERQCGGLTAIALIAASRLGARCAYAGVLGRDEFSEFAIQQMNKERIHLGFLKRKTNAPPVHSFIVIDSQKQTRNVFSHRAVEFKLPAEWPPKALIESTRVLFVDHSDLPSMIRATKLARGCGVSVVADLERNSGPRFRELVDAVDHLILSEKFALKLTATTTVRNALKSLWRNGRALVAITCGKQGCYYLEQATGSHVIHQAAFKIDAVDTTGCGDVFHGAYAAALAKGLPTLKRIRFASAAAALKTRCIGAQAGIPTRTKPLKFLREQQTGAKD
jgi:sulfofructose kinase